jgi:hypothetical protein
LKLETEAIMSDAEKKTDHRKLPRRKRPLSTRDQAILLASRTQARTQAQLAKDFHLSQSRISQILRRAARLEAEPVSSFKFQVSSPADAVSTLTRGSERETCNVELGTCNVASLARAQDIFTRALRSFDHWPKALKTTRHADRDGKTLDEQTLRQQPPSHSMLRVALGAHRDLCRLEDQAKQQQAAAEISPEERRQQVEATLAQMYKAACDAGKVEYHLEHELWIRDLVKILLGERHRHWLPVYILAKNIGITLVHPQKPATPTDDDEQSTSSRDQSSHPGSSLGTHYPEAPASSSDENAPGSGARLVEGGPPGYGVPREDAGNEMETCNSSSNCSNPASRELTELQPPSELSIQNPKSKIQNDASKPVSPEVRDYLIKLRRLRENKSDALCHPAHIWNCHVTDDEIREYEKRAAANCAGANLKLGT